MQIGAWCINLDRATQRWARLQENLRRDPLPFPVHRFPAVEGKQLTPDQLGPDVITAHVRWNLRHRLQICDRNQLNTVEAVGCSLSHRDVWTTFLADPTPLDLALVLEDDACLACSAAELVAAIESLYACRDQWDIVLLGYHDLVPRLHTQRQRTILGPTCSVAAIDRNFYGSHGYLVTREGARLLLKHSLPFEIHVDIVPPCLHELGLLRAYLWPTSLVNQCEWFLESGIPHGGLRLVNYKLTMPNSPVRSVLLLGLVLGLLIIGLLFYRWRGAKGQ